MHCKPTLCLPASEIKVTHNLNGQSQGQLNTVLHTLSSASGERFKQHSDFRRGCPRVQTLSNRGVFTVCTKGGMQYGGNRGPGGEAPVIGSLGDEEAEAYSADRTLSPERVKKT